LNWLLQQASNLVENRSQERIFARFGHLGVEDPDPAEVSALILIGHALCFTHDASMPIVKALIPFLFSVNACFARDESDVLAAAGRNN
jgi:hypothetical protein